VGGFFFLGVLGGGGGGGGGGRRPVHKTDNLSPSSAVVTKSGKLNFLEPSEPLRACDGTNLPFPAIRKINRISHISFLENQFKILIHGVVVQHS